MELIQHTQIAGIDRSPKIHHPIHLLEGAIVSGCECCVWGAYACHGRQYTFVGSPSGRKHFAAGVHKNRRSSYCSRRIMLGAAKTCRGMDPYRRLSKARTKQWRVRDVRSLDRKLLGLTLLRSGYLVCEGWSGTKEPSQLKWSDRLHRRSPSPAHLTVQRNVKRILSRT